MIPAEKEALNRRIEHALVALKLDEVAYGSGYRCENGHEATECLPLQRCPHLIVSQWGNAICQGEMAEVILHYDFTQWDRLKPALEAWRTAKIPEPTRRVWTMHSGLGDDLALGSIWENDQDTVREDADPVVALALAFDAALNGPEQKA